MIPRTAKSIARRPRAAVAALAALALAVACSTCRAPAAGDARESPLAQARRVLGNAVREAIPVPGDDGHARYLAALLAEEDSTGEARTVALLEGGPGRWRVASLHHTLLPVPDSSALLPFGAADTDGDGRPEVYVVGSAWSIMGSSVGVDVIRPGGLVFRYALTADQPEESAHAVWDANAARDPVVLGWMAGRAQHALAEVEKVREANWMTTPLGGYGGRLTRRQALDEARQRLGWRVLEAYPVGREGLTDIVALVGSRLVAGGSRALVLWGNDHVYGIRAEIPLRSSTVWDHRGHFGLVDVDGDGREEVYTVGTESGSSGAYAVIVSLYEPATGLGSQYVANGVDEEGRLAMEWDARVDSLPGARRWMDSVARAVAAGAFGPPRPVPAREASARADEDAWQGENAMDLPPRGVPGPARRGLPRVGSAACAVRDGAVTWLSYRQRGVWRHDTARGESRVVYSPGWTQEWATSLLVGQRYVWTNVMLRDSVSPPALLAFDKHRDRLVAIPLPALDNLPGTTCRWRCWKRAGEELRVDHGLLTLDGVVLALPLEIDAGRELRGARACWADS